MQGLEVRLSFPECGRSCGMSWLQLAPWLLSPGYSTTVRSTYHDTQYLLTTVLRILGLFASLALRCPAAGRWHHLLAVSDKETKTSHGGAVVLSLASLEARLPQVDDCYLESRAWHSQPHQTVSYGVRYVPGSSLAILNYRQPPPPEVRGEISGTCGYLACPRPLPGRKSR